MSQLNMRSINFSMKRNRIQENMRMKASGIKVTESPIKDMTSLIFMTSLWIQMIAIIKTYFTDI